MICRAARILDASGQPVQANRTVPLPEVRPDNPRRPVQARYDVAQTNGQNAQHWAMSDSLDADSANSLAVRKKVRERARYEVSSNSYLRGIVLTLANHEIGSGPTIQVQTGNSAFNAMVEARFAEWCEAIDLPAKLRTMAQARVVDGEAFALLVVDPRIEGPVKLNLRLIEADCVTSPKYTDRANYVDGIHLDPVGNPIAYDVLRVHPGSSVYAGKFEHDTIDAKHVLHWFRCDRPGQHRGMSEIMPSLSIMPGLRRFTAATIKAAETAADIAVFLETDHLANGEAAQIDPGAVDIPMGSMVASPDGWKAKQIAAEHPNGTFTEFRRQIINEASRCVNMPYNIAACDSSTYNFASGQLDHQTYFVSIGVSQSSADRTLLRKIIAAWFFEACHQYGWAVPDSPPPPTQCYWVGRPYANPVDEANAIETNLRTGNTTHALEYARRGLDCETEWTKQASLLGVSLDQFKAALFASVFTKPAAPAATKPEPAKP